MSIVIKPGLSPKDRAMIENAMAQARQNAADIEYIAMMSDIDLDDGEENSNEQKL